ncbi:MAG TPA: lipoate--protein ligase [Candidatus Cloacimonadota bacterium]|nr:lipoate--protein ligase [Candidatus Cloacimonadota bacterium]
MLNIFSPSNYAPFNIAAEEYILNTFDEDCFLLYINSPCIIVGRFQNTLAEINHDWVKEHNIPVVRRLTGGGTVFHDLGNLNFSFIMKGMAESSEGFARYTAPVLEVLNDLGVPAILQGRNDLTINGLKFSGNAKLVAEGKTLQHGTILFSSHVENLVAALKVNPLKFSDKAVKSVRARVTNVSDHLKSPMQLAEFIPLVRAKVHGMYPQSRNYFFTTADKAAIQSLVESKYDTWDWNYGKSPQFTLAQAVRTAAGTVELYLNVEAGTISSLTIHGDFFCSRDISELQRAFQGVQHTPEAVREAFIKADYQSYLGATALDEIINAMF